MAERDHKPVGKSKICLAQCFSEIANGFGNACDILGNDTLKALLPVAAGATAAAGAATATVLGPPFWILAGSLVVTQIYLRQRERKQAEADATQHQAMEVTLGEVHKEFQDADEEIRALAAKFGADWNPAEQTSAIGTLAEFIQNHFATITEKANKIAQGQERQAADLQQVKDMLRGLERFARISTDRDVNLGTKIEDLLNLVSGLDEQLKNVIDANRQPLTDDLTEFRREMAADFASLEAQGNENTERIIQEVQRNQPKPKTLHDLLGLFVPEETQEPASNKIHPKRLRYAYRLVPQVVGREAEQAWLKGFMEREDPFLWASLVGRGGAGKSRLALELVLLHQQAWHAGFVPIEGRIKRMEELDFQDWPTDKPALLVFDYLQIDIREISSFLNRLMRAHLPQRVRVLLLDRIFVKYSFSEVVKESLGEYGFCEQEGDPPERRLIYLGADDFVAAFEGARIALGARELSAEEHENLRNERVLPPEDRLPLIAGLIAMYVAAGNTIGADRWTSDDLKTWFFSHIKKHWPQGAELQPGLHAVTLATLVGGTDQGEWDWVQGADDLPLDGNAWPPAQRVLGEPQSASVKLPAFTPDPLAEYFVRQRVAGEDAVASLTPQVASDAKRLVLAILDNPNLQDPDAVQAQVLMVPALLETELAGEILDRLDALPAEVREAVLRKTQVPEVAAYLLKDKGVIRRSFARDVRQEIIDSLNGVAAVRMWEPSMEEQLNSVIRGLEELE